MEPKTAKRSKRPRRPKTIEEAVKYAISHRTRVQILIVLNEGIFTSAQIAQRIDEQLNNVQNHLRKMLADGSIEIAKEEQKRNFIVYWYKRVKITCYTQEMAEAMTPLEQQVTVSAVLQPGLAEILAALDTGKLRDPRSCLYWDWCHLDRKGRKDLEAENLRYLERVKEIEVEATNRRAKSKEDSDPMLVNLAVCERARKVVRSANSD